ncbi:GreA/GreB family elongation factor [Gangjinia marincola]|uniref:GreA/GreB family elongation factor n=1 Tax=Gangjinia marincola TaxID=578463 RepID=UPI0031D4B47A
MLLKRIQSARVLTHEQTPPDIRFGAHITYTVDANPTPITIQIVGVDEASVPQQKIAFTAPIAKALIGKKPGEQVALELGGTTRQLKVLEVTYS